MAKTLEAIMESFNLPPTARELETLLYDYEKLGQHYAAIIQRYETEETPSMRVGHYFCPHCMHRVELDDRHCRKCGQKMGWKVIRKQRKKKRR